MNYRYLLFLLIINPIFYACKSEIPRRNFENLKIDEIKIDSASIRAIHVLKDSSLFYATSNGLIGMTLGHDKVHFNSNITYDTIVPHFRSIASNGESLFVLSIGNPALLFKLLDGESKLVYKEVHEKVFYDSMVFFDEQNGIAMGDPTDDCLSIILTKDGGDSWSKIPCSNLPKTEEGEAAYAASNTNIAFVGSHAWLATGGKQARVFHTPDMGLSWKVYDTPITKGGKMTGIYSIAFNDSINGIIFGGNWEDKNNNVANKAVTTDGGKTWKLIADGKEPGYKSCVQYVPDTQAKELFAVSSNGISFSNDGGNLWKEVSSEKDYYTIKFVNKNVAWLAGKNKIGKLILE